jgi:hypothetical protein
MNFELGNIVRVTNAALPQFNQEGAIDYVGRDVFQRVSLIRVEFANNVTHAFDPNSLTII